MAGFGLSKPKAKIETPPNTTENKKTKKECLLMQRRIALKSVFPSILGKAYLDYIKEFDGLKQGNAEDDRKLDSNMGFRIETLEKTLDSLRDEMEFLSVKSSIQKTVVSR